MICFKNKIHEKAESSIIFKYMLDASLDGY